MVIDPDYEYLCGIPQIKSIYYFGGWYEVVVTDIGRAPQPETPRTGDELLDQPEPFQIRRYSMDARAWMRNQIIDCLRNEPEGLSTKEIGARLGIEAKRIGNCIYANPRIFDQWTRREGRGRGVTYAKLREAPLQQRGGTGKTWAKDRIVACMENEPAGLSVEEIRNRTGMTHEQVYNCLRNRDVFETWLEPHSSGRGMTYAKLR